MAKTNISEKSTEWRNGYQRGAAHAKETIWLAVYDYVHRHNPKNADILRERIIQAMTEKSAREREAESATP